MWIVMKFYVDVDGDEVTFDANMDVDNEVKSDVMLTPEKVKVVQDGTYFSLFIESIGGT